MSIDTKMPAVKLAFGFIESNLSLSYSNSALGAAVPRLSDFKKSVT